MVNKIFNKSGRWNKSRLMSAALAIGAVALLASIAAPVDARPNRGPTTVSGNAFPSLCNGEVGVGALELTGDIEGCLTFLDFDFECQELNGFALYTEAGSESFVGSVNGVEGTFNTRYTLEATYVQGSCEEFNAGGFPFLQQLTGGCDHFIVNGTGAFRDARGVVTFYDVIPDPGESGASNFFYKADIRNLRT